MTNRVLIGLLTVLTSLPAVAQLKCAPFFPRENLLNPSFAGTYELVPESCVHEDGKPDAWANELYKVIHISTTKDTPAMSIRTLECGKSQPCDVRLPVTYSNSLQYVAQTVSQGTEDWSAGGLTCQLPHEIVLKRNISTLTDLVEREDELKSNHGLRMSSHVLKFHKNGTLEWKYKVYDSFTSPMLSWFTRGPSKCVFIKKN